MKNNRGRRRRRDRLGAIGRRPSPLPPAQQLTLSISLLIHCHRSMRTPPSGDASSEAPEREARVARVPADLAPVREREDGNRLLRIKKSPDMIDVVPPSGW